MAKKEISIPEQVAIALDGRSQRWLALEIKMPEYELSKRMNDHTKFSEEELCRIEERLNYTIIRDEVSAAK